jgi:hypothetical protein
MLNEGEEDATSQYPEWGLQMGQGKGGEEDHI